MKASTNILIILKMKKKITKEEKEDHKYNNIFRSVHYYDNNDKEKIKLIREDSHFYHYFKK